MKEKPDKIIRPPRNMREGSGIRLKQEEFNLLHLPLVELKITAQHYGISNPDELSVMNLIKLILAARQAKPAIA